MYTIYLTRTIFNNSVGTLQIMTPPPTPTSSIRARKKIPARQYLVAAMASFYMDTVIRSSRNISPNFKPNFFGAACHQS